MSDRSDLQSLAERIFLLTRRDVWLGGRSPKRGSWPLDVEYPNWSNGYTWTLSPEVVLGGHRMRICVSSEGDGSSFEYRVRVFVDGAVKHPGGLYDEFTWFGWEIFENWAGRIARHEREEGGRDGPVDRRDLLIAEANQRIQGLSQPRRTLPKEDLAATAAAKEVEALLQRTRGKQ